jgi:DNA processing protein
MLYETILINDSRYPPLLKKIGGAPEKIFVRGNLKLGAPAIAIVGTRKPSRYGIEAAQFFSRELAKLGFSIVSGLAFGIDKEAHEACLEIGGHTVAVLASGVDVITPSSHTGLASRILQNGGAIISEFPPGAQARPEQFPQRNRLISGLSLGVVVIEAPAETGALITARYAAEQNREVFVVPGSIFSPNYSGSHALIREGATLVHRPEEILEELKYSAPLELKTQEERMPALSENERKLLELISEKLELTADELIRLTGINASELAQLLTLLEMKRYIRKENDKIFPVEIR